MPRPHAGPFVPLAARRAARPGAAFLLTLAGLAACSLGDPLPQQEPSSHLRFVQAIPDAPAVDLVLDDTPVRTALGYSGVTEFMRITSGSRRVRVRSAGTATTLLDDTLQVEFPRAYTLVATGMSSSAEAVVAPDTAPIPLPGEFKLRVIQAAPSAGTVDLYVTDVATALTSATPLLEDLPFRGNSEYFTLPVGRHRIRLTTAGTTNVVLDLTEVFGERVMRSVVAIDAPGGGPPLSRLLLIDF